MLCIKDSKKQEAFNSALCRTIYVPVLAFSAIFFTVINILLLPFAFAKSLFHKFILYKRSQGMSIHRNKFLMYIFTGIPMLLISIFTDLYWFIKHSYKWNMQRVQEANAYPKISLRAFNKFYNMVDELPGEKYNAKKLVLEANVQFKTH